MMFRNTQSLLFAIQRFVAARHVSVNNVILTQSRSVTNVRRRLIPWTDAVTPRLLRHRLSLQHRDISPPGLCSTTVLIVRRGLCSSKDLASIQDASPVLPDHLIPDTDTEGVYVIQARGLPWSCTAQDLLRFFSGCNVIGGEKGVHLIQNVTGKPTGQAFIEMKHEEDVRKALEKHKAYLGSRYVEVYEVTDYDAEAIMMKSIHPSSKDGVVRLRGLPFKSTEADIRKFFSGLDIVDDGVTIVRDRDNLDRHSGTAYVQFSSSEMAEEAFQRNNAVIWDRYIEVFPSERREIKQWTSPRWTSARPSSKFPSNREVTDGNTDGVVRLRGLPRNATEADIRLFFSGLDIVDDGVTRVKKLREGCAFVQFASKEIAEEALQRDRQFIGNRYIELFPSDRRELQRIQKQSGQLFIHENKRRIEEFICKNS